MGYILGDECKKSLHQLGEHCKNLFEGGHTQHNWFQMLGPKLWGIFKDPKNPKPYPNGSYFLCSPKGRRPTQWTNLY